MDSNQKKTIMATAALVFIFSVCYLVLGNKPASTEMPVVNTEKDVVSEPTTDIALASVVALADIKLTLPEVWSAKQESDSSIILTIPGIKSSVALSVDKCEESDNKICFGSAQSNYKKTANGGIVDLSSTLNTARFGVELGNPDSPSSYDISFIFSDEDYQLSQAEGDMFRNVAMSAALQ